MATKDKQTNQDIEVLIKRLPRIHDLIFITTAPNMVYSGKPNLVVGICNEADDRPNPCLTPLQSLYRVVPGNPSIRKTRSHKGLGLRSKTFAPIEKPDGTNILDRRRRSDWIAMVLRI